MHSHAGAWERDKVYAIYDIYDKENNNVTTDDMDYNTIALGMQVAF